MFRAILMATKEWGVFGCLVVLIVMDGFAWIKLFWNHLKHLQSGVDNNTKKLDKLEKTVIAQIAVCNTTHNRK